MSGRLRVALTSRDPAVRDRPLACLVADLDVAGLLAECADLEAFRRETGNLYERVRALFFLCSIHRDELPKRAGFAPRGRVPYDGYRHLLARRFEEAIAVFLRAGAVDGPNDALSSAFAQAYHQLGFQTLADQVRRSVRSAHGNQWMFRVGHPLDQPLRLRPEVLARASADAPFPVLHERTPVRMDLTHSAWSDIFFLGMDHPEGARVLNASVDLAVRGRDPQPEPPIECWLRVIDAPVLRLCSVDLGAFADIDSLEEVFDFARDYLGLLKAAVIGAGVIPPGLEGSDRELRQVLATLCGEGRGLEVVSRVRDIPKGSRLAVSTNLLASLIALCMRATGQTKRLTGPLDEGERRTVAARAILGEWLGGSGGGWQDSGGIWPGLKRIEGQLAGYGDPEASVSRGRLLPGHQTLDDEAFPAAARQGLQDGLVLVHGGMAQNVGPILEMVTEKYLLRREPERTARLEAESIFDEILAGLRSADMDAVARATSRNFEGPITTIVPWATNAFTAAVIEELRARLGDGYRGFLMLGGMSGGGMGFFVDPKLGPGVRDLVQEVLLEQKRRFADALPFAMDPVVYDFSINPVGTSAELVPGEQALLAEGYYALVFPSLLRVDPSQLPLSRRRELERVGNACRSRPSLSGLLPRLFDAMLPAVGSEGGSGQVLAERLEESGFDRELHERVRRDLLSGRVGLAQNRLPPSASIEDVTSEDVVDTLGGVAPRLAERGLDALSRGEVAVVTLAGGAASRWTQGAGVVKALHPFCRFDGRHRSFLDVHLAKTRRVAAAAGARIPHVFTTSVFTHGPIERALRAHADDGHVLALASPGRAVGLRLVPTERDLRFLWEETSHQVLDERRQRMRESVHEALIGWARASGEASDYTDNLPNACLHPIGHFFEVPNMFRNGVLRRLIEEQPQLRWLCVHNVDTVGVDLDPARLGLVLESGRAMTFEVVPRRIEDVGGGLARVDGRVRLVEGLAMPDEAAEFRLSYYNTGTTWVDLDALFDVFGLTRDALADEEAVTRAVRRVAERMPTYVTIKDVKKRWGHGQEDVFPVSQFEKLWGDLSALPELSTAFHVVPRVRGQQLKDPAQLEGFVRDGSARFVEQLCAFGAGA
ncbi:MAG: UTP--glucose-1-phosphate uridylyltransferase [Planctomycetota bacterium]|nr:UTP--glucose-1-phosphate uridylyltransferase [Planctomycetota bacterium]